MSGIVGVINLDGAPIDRELLAQLTTYMSFRGPDHQDLWIAGNVGFGHTLLRTTFESAQERGVTTLDGEVWITADVRLDGRTELIETLRAKGAPVATTVTDVELVLHAYQLWGEAALEHLMGDFAFGIWDGRCQRLFCAHDHFGVVPLCYAQIQNCLLFSNTLNTLRLHPAVSDRLNEQSIGEFLLFGHYPNLAATAFADIQRLPPAHALTCLDGQVSVRRYYELPREVEYIRYRQPEEYVDHFRERFDEAVADRLRTDRAGTHLSGGMDSTSIAATAQKLLRETGNPFDLRAYTTIYEELITDQEGYYAGLVADTIGVPIEYLAVETYLRRPPADLPTFLLSEPSLIPSQVVEYAINERVVTYSRIIFAGFGGDPAFEPVPLPAYYGQLFKTGQLGLLATDIGRLIRERNLPRLGLRAMWRRSCGTTSSQTVLPTWLQPDFVARQNLETRWTRRQVSPQRDRYGMMSAPLWTNIFAASDPGMSGLPLRLRFPFFDLRLVNYLLTVPPLPWLQNKRLLRQAMRDRLPQPVLQRRKTVLRGHPRHLHAQTRGVQTWMRELLDLPAMAAYIDREVCLYQLQTIETLTPAASDQLSLIFPLAYWLRHRHHRIYPEQTASLQLFTHNLQDLRRTPVE